MKILMLNYEFPPLGGGCANANFYLFEQFKNYPNLEIDLVTSSTGNFRIENFATNIRIHYLDIGKGEKNFHYQTNKELISYSRKAYRYSKKIIKKEHFDLIHAFFGIPSGFLAQCLKLPYLVCLRGSDVPFYNQRFHLLDKMIFARMSKKIWRKAQFVIANSQGLKDLAHQTNSKQKIEVIYNGVDVEKFHPIEQKNNNSKKIKLISVGRLIERKGYDFLFQALKNLDGFELTLIGNGKHRANLEKLAQELKITVHFLGRQNQDKIIDALQKSDVFVLPSLNEGMSNSLLEALACGLGVVVTDVGGSSELVDGNGFVVEKASALALQKALENYQKDASLIEKQAVKSRQIAEKMSWQNMAKAYFEIYQKMKEQ